VKFRPDIEGLRAVAVVLVVAAHAKVRGLAGGFVGVDVFFVLSGYLITALLVHELEAHGRIDLPAFYARRFRRLFPALLVVLAATCVFAWQLLPPGEQPAQGVAAAAAALWLSNFHFAASSMDYFGPKSENNLFLHTWSLGVEEQFYLLWPALLLALGPGRRLRLVMPALALLGCLACVAWTARSPLLAFYMMPARAWQFALGATVFLFIGRRGGAANAHWPAALGWLGLAAILWAAFLLDGRTPYPGAWAALPSLGAAAVLAGGASLPRGGVGRLLSLAPLQALGGVSYVWYLWHWPVLLLGATVLDFARPEVRAGLVLLSLLLAAGTHLLVEAPLRDRVRFPARASRVVVAALAAMAGATVLALQWQQQARGEAQDAQRQPYELARIDAPSIYAMGCDELFRSDAVRICEFGSGAAGKTAVMLGDSVALQWLPALDAALVPRGWRLLVITKSACPMVDEPVFYAGIGRRYTECERWRASALAFLAQLRPDVVVMGSSYAYDFSERQWREGSARVLKAFAPAAGRVYVLASTPSLPFDGPSCLAPRGWLYRHLAGASRCVAPLAAGRRDDVWRWLHAAAAAVPNVRLVDLTDVVCPAKVCAAQRQGVIVFRDSQHITATFARSKAAELARILDLERSAGH
jgi:peptidoglycan/LPS O-acetylase OafA/YrhL